LDRLVNRIAGGGSVVADPVQVGAVRRVRIVEGGEDLERVLLGAQDSRKHYQPGNDEKESGNVFHFSIDSNKATSVKPIK
jgi:hypothetical protein